jgi:YgiT-type zinc finger domain-containing protein
MKIAEVAGKPCDMCGQGVYVIKQVPEPVTVNGKMTFVSVTVAECSHCGERIYDEAVRTIQAAYNQLAKTA